MIDGRRYVDTQLELRRRDELGDDEIEQCGGRSGPHQAETLGDRHDVARRDVGTVGPADPASGPRGRRAGADAASTTRLEGGNDAALVERADDGRRSHACFRGASPRVPPLGRNTSSVAAPPQLAGAERLVHPDEQLVNGFGVPAAP